MEVKFSEDDLKGIEDVLMRALTRALVRAARIIVREGIFTGLAGASQVADDVQDVAPLNSQPVAPEPVPNFKPVQTAPQPVFEHAVIEPVRPSRFQENKKPRRSAREVCKTVADRPHGYITTDEACEFVGGPYESTRATLNHWILDRQVAAVIVANIKPPTKGLPGRLMVEKRSLDERNKIRLANLGVSPRNRQSVPSVEAVQ